MEYDVFVKLGKSRDFDFRLHEGDLAGATPQSARRWFERQFEEMGCLPTNPTGKTLLVDLIVGVAKALGERPFASGEPLAREFARNAAAALQRPRITIDVEALSIH